MFLCDKRMTVPPIKFVFSGL